MVCRTLCDPLLCITLILRLTLHTCVACKNSGTEYINLMKLITNTSLSVVALALIFAGGCSLNRPSELVSLAPENQSATSTEEVIDTSNWKTYRNEEMGFEMKVPKEWEDPKVSYDVYGSVTWEVEKEYMYISIERLNIRGQEHIDEYSSSRDDKHAMTLNGLDAYQLSYQCDMNQGKIEGRQFYVQDLIIIKDDVEYLIESKIKAGKDRAPEEQVESLKSILESFKIFESVVMDLKGFSIVRNESLKLEMEVPNAWGMNVRTSADEIKVDFETKWHDYITLDVNNVIISRGADFEDFKIKNADSISTYNIYETFDQLHSDVKNNFDINPTLFDNSEKERPSFWGNSIKILVKDDKGYYKISTLMSGSTKEHAAEYNLELKRFLETIKKMN
jgi:hypothetical protein